MKKLLTILFTLSILVSSLAFSLALSAAQEEDVKYVWSEQVGAGQRYWYSVTSSADGTKLAVFAGDNYDGYIYTSADSGKTWATSTEELGEKYWISITSSADGSKLAAIARDDYSQIGYIYTSVDSGKTWTEQKEAGLRPWYSIASSADGTKLIAVVEPVESDVYIYLFRLWKNLDRTKRFWGKKMVFSSNV